MQLLPGSGSVATPNRGNVWSGRPPSAPNLGAFTRNVSPGWLSGTIDETMIYEKAMFSCGGELITTFAMTYPVAECGFYDRLVEGVEHTFRPSPKGCYQDGSSF